MKKLLIMLLTLALCLTTFFACGEETKDESKTDSKTESAGTTEDSKAEESRGSESSENEGNKVPIDIPIDILKDLPYTLVCKDKYTGEVADFQFNDEGKLNDGLYRNETELENEVGNDMRVDFEGTSGYNFQITFEVNDSHGRYRLFAHNCDFNFSFLKIEVGSDIDNMTELDFEDDHDITVNMHCDNYAEFTVAKIDFLRITITTGIGVRTSFDELTLFGIQNGEEDISIESTEEITESDIGDGEHDGLLIGTWGADDPEIVEKGGSDYKVVITFVSDGTGNYKQAGFDLPMTWSTKDGTLYLEMPMAGQQSRLYHFEDGCLIMPDEDGRITKFVKL